MKEYVSSQFLIFIPALSYLQVSDFYLVPRNIFHLLSKVCLYNYVSPIIIFATIYVFVIVILKRQWRLILPAFRMRLRHVWREMRLRATYIYLC